MWRIYPNPDSMQIRKKASRRMSYRQNSRGHTVEETGVQRARNRKAPTSAGQNPRAGGPRLNTSYATGTQVITNPRPPRIGNPTQDWQAEREGTRTRSGRPDRNENHRCPSYQTPHTRGSQKTRIHWTEPKVATRPNDSARARTRYRRKAPQEKPPSPEKESARVSREGRRQSRSRRELPPPPIRPGKIWN